MSGVSCIVCAYNEAERLPRILETIVGHPDLDEVIVVDDGSTDGPDAILDAFPSVRLVSYGANRGKTYAMAQGVSAARGDHLMFLDADLSGLGGHDVRRLLAPVLDGTADATLSLRANSLPLYRAIGLDFVTGERVVPAWLLQERAAEMERLPRWGAEVFINGLMIAAGLRLAVVDWPGVYNVRKYAKFGALRGLAAEIGMVGDAIRTLSPYGVVQQHLDLLRLSEGNRRLSPWKTPRLRSGRKAVA